MPALSVTWDHGRRTAGYYIGEPWRRELPPEHNRQGTRRRGTNPRARGTNPRRLGTNPSASEMADIARVGRLRRRALARWRTRTGTAWCELCDDTGTVAGDDGRYSPCAGRRQITANEAADILDGYL